MNINVGPPAWGPQVPYGTQYYYIPEIDGYYDLYSQQYLVYQDGYWVPLPQLYGYDPYQFHPVVIDYRGREPWLFRRDYYHRQYAYAPYRRYGPGPGYSRPRHDNRRGYPNGRNYSDYRQSPGGYHSPRGNQPPQLPQPSSNPQGQGGGRGNDRGNFGPGQGRPGGRGTSHGHGRN